MDKKDVKENVVNINQAIPTFARIANKYLGDAVKNADTEALYAIMGTQATYMHNMSKFILGYADVDDERELDALIETAKKMDNLAQGCADVLGLGEIHHALTLDDEKEEDDEDGHDITEEDVDEFAKQYKLNKTETKVLKKIVMAKGHPTDMTEKEQEIAMKMAPKIHQI